MSSGGGGLARSSDGFAVAGAGVAGVASRPAAAWRGRPVARGRERRVAGVASSSDPSESGDVCWSRPNNRGAATWPNGPSDGEGRAGVAWRRRR